MHMAGLPLVNLPGRISLLSGNQMIVLVSTFRKNEDVAINT